MTYILPLALAAIGAFFLYKGAALLIDNATSLARNLGVPVIVIGFTIIALGTSMPELVVGIIAAAGGENQLVLGNIFGSNMANFGLVLGLAALISPFPLPAKNHRLEFFSLILSSALLFILVRDGRLGRLDGALLLSLGIGFCYLTIKHNRDVTIVQQQIERIVTIQHRRERLINFLALLAGMTLIFVGARMLVTNAVVLARLFRVSDMLIGLTIVAIGTSLPEIVTSVVSGVRRTSDLALGNAVGSNIMNILVVLGLTVLISPIQAGPTLWRFDLPVLILASVLVAAALGHSKRLTRLGGGLMVAAYFAYIISSLYIRGGQVF